MKQTGPKKPMTEGTDCLKTATAVAKADIFDRFGREDAVVDSGSAAAAAAAADRTA